ncbi:Anaphase-promoting complex (APC), Cdc23 subunit, partial [Pseudoloma neurophilia]
EDKNTVFKISEDKNTFELSEKVKLFLNNLLGAYYYSKKWYNRSLKHFKKAVYVDYLDFYSHILYIKEEKHALSQLAYFLIERDPFSIEGLISLGNCFSLRKEYAKAVKYFKRALKFRPDMIYLNNLIGHEHLDHNRPDQAIKFFQKCKDYRSMCGLGQCYLKLEMNHVAIEMFKRSLELNDKNVYGWHSLGNIFRKMNKYKQSIMCFETIYKLKDPLGLLLVGEVYKEQKKFDLAADYFKKYLEYKDDPKIKKFLDEYYKQRSKITQ